MKVKHVATAAGLLALALPAPAFAGGYGGHEGDSHGGYDSGHGYGHKRDCKHPEVKPPEVKPPAPAPAPQTQSQTQSQTQTVVVETKPVYITKLVYVVRYVKVKTKTVIRYVRVKVKRPRKVHRRRTCRRGSFVVRCNRPRVPTTFRG